MKNIFKSYKSYIKLSFLFLIMTNFYGCSSLDKNQKSKGGDLKIIGYVAGYEEFDVAKVDSKKLTHINYAFANIVDGGVQFELATDSLKILNLMKLKKYNSNLKILFSIGGWVWSDQFSDIAAYPESREKFAVSAVELMNSYDFDGIDIDWEYPGQLGEDNIFRADDKENFTLLLAEIRKQLNKQDINYKTHHLLTIATGADQKYITHTDLNKAHQYLDFINVMCYDFYSGPNYQTGHHANLYTSDDESFKGNSGFDAINRMLDIGIPANKLILGLPFYGRKWVQVTPNNNGLYQPSKAANDIIPYWKIEEELQSGKYLKLYDDKAKASYLWNAEDHIFISYDTTQEIELKSDFIKSKGLGGAMFWEYSLDNNQKLLNALFDAVRN
ncbi:glycoside hydrolase family 18 protein [Flavobacterium algicola]|uniref:glycoside hydrolase family 18 protein n=1 Tax=Flavobacterium algicola TaxID=556529 RepID=UPI001EFEB5DA|nr:glycoside hydrolase family 18 protein [Flavobacterium algicola]MCG9792265.1 glycoside hydrolase family 18 protein [Flavobacterium algicola]